MDKDKGIQIKVGQSYTCICGTMIAHKQKSLKKHLLTKAHIRLAPCPPHYWIIESAGGHFSNGYCQYCQEQKKFENSIGNGAWGWSNQREYENNKKKEDIQQVEHLVIDET